MTTPADTRARRIAVLAGSAAGLALLIFAFAAFQARSPVEPQAREQSRLLSAQASGALRSGDETLAAALAGRALALDSRNPEAAGVADQVTKRRSTRTADGGSGVADETKQPEPAEPVPGEPGGDGDAAFDDPVEEPAALLPQSFDGYTFGMPVALEGEVSVSASASRKTGPTRILWAIHDVRSKAGAQEFMNGTSRQLYGSDAQDVDIEGADAYFGTDGMRFATVVYSRGRYVFEVLVSGTDDAPAGYRDVAVGASMAFEDTPRR